MNTMASPSTYIQRKTALACPVHMAIKQAAVERLTDKGVFSKEKVLEETNMLAMAEAIRWDYVREFIEEEHGCELMPLAASYFKRHQKEDEHIKPEKYLAQGHGKKTAGYAAVTNANDHLVICRIKYRAAVANGTVKAAQVFIAEVQAKRKALSLDPLPRIAPPVDGIE